MRMYTDRLADSHKWVPVVVGSAGEERQQMAGRCLGELVRKMGDRVLQQIIPILVRGMQHGEPSTRQGVCTGLREVLDNITREQLQEYLAQLLPTVQAALCDEDSSVRQVNMCSTLRGLGHTWPPACSKCLRECRVAPHFFIMPSQVFG